MTLWLVRHAQPLVASGICYGQLDIAADTDATHICATELVKALPFGIAIAASPLQRCEQLAQVLLGLRPDLTYKIDTRLQEMNFGGWEGRAWTDIDARELQAWTAGFASYRAGDTGESVAQLMARVADALDALPAASDTLWITHAGVIRAAQLIASGKRQVEHAGEWPLAGPAYGQWCTLELHPAPRGKSALTGPRPKTTWQ